MIIPASVKHLAVLHFKKHMIEYVPSTVTHLYICKCDRKEAPADRVHYLFSPFSFDGLMNTDPSCVEDYEVGIPFKRDLIGRKMWMVKREPKLAVSRPSQCLCPCSSEIISLRAEVARLKAAIEAFTKRY